jgi:hypothetical protein
MGRINHKIKGSTLMETVIATVIILAVFVVASLILNTTYKGVVQNDTFSIDNRLEELFYLAKHAQISIPYEETSGDYEVYLNTETIDGIIYIQAEATHSIHAKKIQKYHVR